jgi:SWI/SNF-related matrix-associated actin-dependent regulator 1 of chromatin subfamily A
MSIRVRHFNAGLYAIESTSYSPTLRKVAKSTPGMRWEPTANAWFGYADALAIVVKRMRELNIRLDSDALPEPDAELTTTLPIATKDLRDYQKLGVSFVVAHGREGVLLADDMGLGKSAQFTRAARTWKEPTIIVCPSFVRHVWEKEVARWWPEAHVVMLSGVKPPGRCRNCGATKFKGNCGKGGDDEPPHVIEYDAIQVPKGKVPFVVINYDIVHAWAPVLVQSNLVATLGFDEAQYLMSDRSRRSAACKELARQAKRRVGLSGTPMTNRPKDLWNVIDTLSEARFGKAFDFYMRYCEAHKEKVAEDKIVWKMDGASNLEELRERLAYFMIRRTKSDVNLELPPRTRQVVEVEVPRVNVVAFESALINDKALRKALCLAADGKVGDVVELVAAHVAAGHKCVVFTHRKVIAESIADTLRAGGIANVVTITGDVPLKIRQERIASKPTVICATIDSTSVGIDLSFADVAVFAELDWVPSKLAQCESRLHRFGQKRNVLIQYVVARGTIDEVVRATCIAKLESFETAIGPTDDRMKKDFNADAEMGTAQQLKSLFERLQAEG